eukprot:TRINITY_DN3632_c0_g1_i1.p1 TRINITY_DN3632_c0_g1~~TRINITY_DN3632_c0_g1_i1.p1  ORF type:complete len:265 (+),score=49.65 TRINITY_DN3632_c0_g1_i1:104-898(+)
MNTISALVFLFLVALCICDPKPVVRERHDNAIYINIPVSPQSVEHLLPDALEAHLYGGSAWVSILTDALDLLEYYIFGKFVNTHTKGWMTKVNLLVRNKYTKEPGYMITSIDFEDNFCGFIRQKGAQLTQKVPSHRAQYDVNKTSTWLALNYRCDEDSTALKLAPSRLSSEINWDFASYVVNRFVKFLNQNGKTIKQASERGPGDYTSLKGAQTITPVGLSTNLALKRLNVNPNPNWDLCHNMTCFVVPYYILVDHENSDVPRS